jgi:hypothetical protein
MRELKVHNHLAVMESYVAENCTQDFLYKRQLLLCCHLLTKTGMFRNIFAKLTSIKCH